MLWHQGWVDKQRTASKLWQTQAAQWLVLAKSSSKPVVVTSWWTRARARAHAHTHTTSSFITIDKKAGILRRPAVGDRLKMAKHNGWATTIVAPKIDLQAKKVGLMTMRKQIKPTFRISLTASQASQSHDPNIKISNLESLWSTTKNSSQSITSFDQKYPVSSSCAASSYRFLLTYRTEVVQFSFPEHIQ